MKALDRTRSTRVSSILDTIIFTAVITAGELTPRKLSNECTLSSRVCLSEAACWATYIDTGHTRPPLTRSGRAYDLAQRSLS